MSVNTECEDSLTPRDVCSSILQAQRGFINSEPFRSESHERNFERAYEGTYEHSYQQKYESNVSLNKGLIETWLRFPVPTFNNIPLLTRFRQPF